MYKCFEELLVGGAGLEPAASCLCGYFDNHNNLNEIKRNPKPLINPCKIIPIQVFLRFWTTYGIQNRSGNKTTTILNPNTE